MHHCRRCTGLLVGEYLWEERNLWWRRCVNCGWRIDDVIYEKQLLRAHVSPQTRAHERWGRQWDPLP